MGLHHFIPNSESVGFQSLGPGTAHTKMHAPKSQNSPGTLLEPFAVGLQSWANIHDGRLVVWLDSVTFWGLYGFISMIDS